MFEFLSRGRGKADKKEPDAGPSTMPQTMQLSATQRDMARLTLHHLLKLHGIPAHWIAGELVPIRIPGQGEAMLVQLEIVYWNDALVLNTFALQSEFLEGLRRFDPASNGTQYLFSWKFNPECCCPHRQLPDSTFWSGQTSPRPAPEPAPTAAPAPPPVAAAEHERQADIDVDDGFAPTVIHDPDGR